MKKYILMLEGDESDRDLSSRYFNDYGIRCHYVMRSGEVPAFLESKDGKELPALILLSMNAVPDTGLVILKRLKSDARFRHIPVIMLGENTQGNIIRQCYAEGANTFINKPFTDRLADLKIRSFVNYWFEVAEPADKELLQLTRN